MTGFRLQLILRYSSALATPRRAMALAICSICLLMPNVINAEEEDEKVEITEESTEPIYQQDPYDLITLDPDNHDAVLKVFPLDLPNRELPETSKPTDELTLRLVDRPDEQFVVLWQHIAAVKLFEQMVLDRTNQLVEQQNFDDAYDHFRFLERNYPQLAGLKPAVEAFLWKQITLAFKHGRHEQALALLLQLNARNAEYPGLAAALARVTAKLVDRHLAQSRYRAARGLLAGLSQRYPESSAATATKYERILRSKADRLVSDARKHLTTGNLRLAHETAQLALEVWPTVAGGTKLAAEIHAVYPVVTVAVAALAAPTSAAIDWPTLREARLQHVPPAEIVGVGATGGIYRAALGLLEVSDDRSQLVLRNHADSQFTGAAATNARTYFYALPQALARQADPRDGGDRAAWTNAFSAVELHGGETCRIDFMRPQLCPGAYLTSYSICPLIESTVESGSAQPFRRDTSDSKRTIYLSSAHYFAAQASQPKQIEERFYSSESAALGALARGEVQIVDRLPPWLWEQAAKTRSVRLEPYLLPTVHVLVVNPAKPMLASRSYRRALEVGINRQAILEQALLGGQSADGCVVISGPFPRGVDGDDEHGYAYDESIKPRTYDSTLAMMLSSIAMQDVAISEKRQGRSFKAVQTLNLIHPPTAVARVACQSIARQWRLLGTTVTLRELTSGQAWPDDFDVAYVELPMHEPLVDVHALLGERGLAGHCSPAMHAALEKLQDANDWPQAKDRLHAIHRLAHQEVAVISLWQIADRLAYHETMQGIGERPTALYQNATRWQRALKPSNAASTAHNNEP